VDRHQPETTPLIEADGRLVVVGGDEPEPPACRPRRRPPGCSDERRPDTPPLEQGVESDDLALTTRDLVGQQPTADPVEQRHEAREEIRLMKTAARHDGGRSPVHREKIADPLSLLAG
jgi:hypothetical protein